MDRIVPVIVLALALCVLADRVVGLTLAETPARVLALALLIVVIPRFQLREWALLVLASALAFGLWQVPGGLGHLGFALGQAAYFAAFIFLMMLLREAAVTSRSVLEVGAWMTRRSPGKRFVANWLGGHLAGILMNFGAVSLLSPLIQRGVRADPITTPEDERRAKIRERRQLSALIRGFAFVVCWAPTTLTQVIILDAVPGLDPTKAILIGLSLSVIVLGIGWTEDRLRWGAPRMVMDQDGAFPHRAAMDLLIVYAVLILGALIVQGLTGLNLPSALMSIAPLLLIGWVIRQARGSDPVLPDGALPRFGQIVGTSIPNMAKDAYILGAAGFIGIVAARLAPIETIALWLETAHVPAWLIVAALPIVINLAGQIALSPMMMVVFLGAVISALPVLPAAPEYIAIGLAAGWALSITAAPNATGALLVAGATGIPSTRLTWGWNGVYSLIVMAIFAVLAWVFVGA
jgi:hypothetical protein